MITDYMWYRGRVRTITTLKGPDMTETPVKGIAWDSVVPTFSNRLREPKKPPRPSDGAIAMAQKSYDGQERDGVTEHALTHRFPTEAIAAQAVDELKRAGAYVVTGNTPENGATVSTVIDPEDTGDKRIVRWQAGAKRGRK